MKIAIPTYNRAEGFSKKTYELLKKYDLLNHTTLFIQTDEDEIRYKKFNLKIVRSPLGFRETCNFITDYYDKDEVYIQIHDDIKGIYREINGKLIEVENGKELFNECIKTMKQENATLAGFYPVCNAFFMKNQKYYTTTLKFIYDPISIICNQKIKLKHSYNNKEDFERTIEHYKMNNKIVRFNKVAFRTRYNSKTGGIGKRGIDHIKADDTKLLTIYRDYIKSVKTHKDGTTSFILKEAPCHTSK